MVNNVSLESIPAFLAVVEQGSFTRAANHLDVSTAWISKQVGMLEQQLGVQLLLRTTRSVRLTDAGEHYYQSSKRGIDLLKLAAEEAQQSQTELRGAIRVNALGGLFGEQELAPVINQFLLQHPDVSLELDFSSKRVDLIEQDYDLVVRMGELSDSELISRPLVKYRPVCAASPKYVAEFGMPKHPNDIKQHRCITGSLKQWTFIRGGEKLNVHVSSCLSSPNGYVMMRAAIDGLGIANLPDYYLSEPVEQGELIEVLPEWQERSIQISLLYPKHRYRVSRVQALVDYLIASFADR